jgi:hypothetical protein
VEELLVSTVLVSVASYKMRFLNIAALAFAAVSVVDALTPAQWRGQSIYQVLTDRFARTDGSTTASCNTANQAYCGGTWRGIINKLDYIQGMGFTAVRPSSLLSEGLWGCEDIV